MPDLTGHNHDAAGAPTYPLYRDRCPVGCDDLTPVRMADTNVQIIGKDRLVTRRLVPDGPSRFAIAGVAFPEPAALERLAQAVSLVMSDLDRTPAPIGIVGTSYWRDRAEAIADDYAARAATALNVDRLADLFMDLRLDGPAAEGWTYQQTARHYAVIIAREYGGTPWGDL